MPDDPETMLDRIEELLSTGKYEWARETLEGIWQSIHDRGSVTLPQQEAVTHIMIGRLKHDVHH